MHAREPSVERLAIHLPNQNCVVFNATAKPISVASRPDINKTTLTEWFELNKRDADARLLTYSQIPTKYVWNGDSKVWPLRQRGRSIGRVGYVNPAAGELFYMRILLNTVERAQVLKTLRLSMELFILISNRLATLLVFWEMTKSGMKQCRKQGRLHHLPNFTRFL